MARQSVAAAQPVVLPMIKYISWTAVTMIITRKADVSCDTRERQGWGGGVTAFFLPFLTSPLVPTRGREGRRGGGNLVSRCSRDKLSNWSGDWIINRGSQAPKDRKQRWRTVSSSGGNERSNEEKVRRLKSPVISARVDLDLERGGGARRRGEEERERER